MGRETLPLPYKMLSVEVVYFGAIYLIHFREELTDWRWRTFRCIWMFVVYILQSLDTLEETETAMHNLSLCAEVFLDWIKLIVVDMNGWLCVCIFSATLPLSCQINMAPINSGSHIDISIYTYCLSSVNMFEHWGLAALFRQQMIEPNQPLALWRWSHGWNVNVGHISKGLGIFEPINSDSAGRDSDGKV